MTRRITSSKKFLSTSALTLGLLAFGAQAMAMDDFTTPTGEQVIGGAATFDRPEAGVLNITQSTDRVVINWDSFNIGTQGKTEFFQPGAGSLAVNRVTGADTNPTQILGTLKSNGQVMVLDRNGILFGHNAVLDVGGIVASTGDVDSSAVMRGDAVLTLTGFGDNAVINNGVIRVADAGLAAFVAPHAANNGVIEARMGKVVLAAGGESATVDLYGDGLVELAVGGAEGKALVENAGTINAAGGTVLMSTTAAKGVVDNVVNMSGVVNVASVTQKGGKIILSAAGGAAKVSGTMEASGEHGGSVSVTGQDVDVSQEAMIFADGGSNGNGGDIYFYANNNTTFRGRAFARGGVLGGNGGFVEVSAANELGYDGAVSTLATNGISGTFLLDPLFATIHSGALNSANPSSRFLSAAALANDLANNAEVIVQADVHINVGATAGSSGVGTGDIDVSTGAKTTTTTVITGYVAKNPNNPGHVTACAGPAAASNDHCMAVIATTTTTTNILTQGHLILQSAIVNLNKTLILGAGNLTVDAGTLNMVAKILGRSVLGGETVLLGDARLIGGAGLQTINVLSQAGSINQAINFADDDTALTTINVGNGFYSESVQADKNNVTLKGGLSSTIAPNSPGFKVTGNNVTIDGFSIQGATGADGYGIWVESVANVILKNNWISGVAQDGIFARNAQGLVINNNDVNNTGGDAIDVSDSEGVIVRNNRIGTLAGFGNVGGYGISVVNAPSVVIRDNQVENFSGTGIFVDPSPFAAITGNTVLGGEIGIHVLDSDDVRIGGSAEGRANTITDSGTGILVENSHHAAVLKNEVYGAEIGIHILDSTHADVFGNVIGGSGYGTGILVENGDYARIGAGVFPFSVFRNTISDVETGVDVRGTESEGVDTSDDVAVVNNGISSVYYGVMAQDTNGLTVEKNDLTGWGEGTGVLVGNSNNVGIFGGNNIDSFENGITVQDSYDVRIRNNDVWNMSYDGIQVFGGDNVLIARNRIDNVGNDGIYAGEMLSWNYDGESYDLLPNLIVRFNTIDWTGGDGIEVGNVTYSRIVGNRIGLDGYATAPWEDYYGYGEGYSIGGTGILVGTGYMDDPTFISDNLVANTGWNGIQVGGVEDVTITRNTVWNTYANGIEVNNGFWVNISDNFVGAERVIDTDVEASTVGGGFVGWSGIVTTNYFGGGSIFVENNAVSTAGYDGISVYGASEARIRGNTVGSTGNDGIAASNVGESYRSMKFFALIDEGGDLEGRDPYYSLIISNNTVTDAGQLFNSGDGGGDEECGDCDTLSVNQKMRDFGGDGIDVSFSGSTLIESNVVANAFDDGIVVLGQDDGYLPAGFLSEFGMDPFSTPVVIRDNDVTDSGVEGVEIVDVRNAVVDLNRILNSGTNGFRAGGMYNGDVVLTGNSFTGNPVGALFESGRIDLTGAANAFDGGTVGMRFRPKSSEQFVGFEEEMFFMPGAPIFETVFAKLSLVDDTIGTTIFSGQSQFYVELQNGALFNPGTPTILDGMNATYDGFKPASVGGFLSVAQYNALESRIYHYNDENTLGLFFFGLAAPGGGVDQEDIFKQFAGFNPGTGRITITLTGLPNLPGAGNAPGNAGGNGNAGLASFLASISPAAGGEDEAEDMASLAPGAGSSSAEAACWSQAAAQASAGAAVSYTLSGTIENILNQAVACGNSN